MEKIFSQSELEGISQALADTNEGLTGSEIGSILQSLKIKDPTPDMTKWKRLYNALEERQYNSRNRRAVLEFIRQAIKPVRYTKQPERFETMRANLNRTLSFAGIAILDDGSLVEVKQAQTISEAYRRADELRLDLIQRGVHPDVLFFCREELVVDNYFHAVLEATKSIADKLRKKTGLIEDGASLVDAALGGNQPVLAINSFVSGSERSEQSGFVNLVKGIFGMFRNTTAHAPRALWNISKEDAEDLLSIVSLIHRRLDKC